MIEDKKLGLKVAVNSIEALWEKVRQESESLIKQSENNLIVQRAMNEMAKEKLKNFSRNNEEK